MAGVQEVLADRFELLEVLGRGGMGVVYRARDRVLDRVVAVKVLPLDRAQDPTTVARFEREALAAAALSHRNIVSVFDFGVDQETRFIVMEYLAGQSLAQRLHEHGALAVNQAVDVVAQVAAALAAAHAAGIVHRDIKPANVMIDEQGHVKVLDFGIARLTAGISLTQTATVLGSASYLAPELCRGAPADARSDIYALGCVLFELLTGAPPFTGELPAAIVHQQLSAEPRSPRELNAAIPAGLAALCLAMLAKDPDQRPRDAGELITALPAALVDPAAGVATAVLPAAGAAGPEPAADAAPTTELASDVAATLPLAAAGVVGVDALAAGRAAGAVDRTQVMPARPGGPPPRPLKPPPDNRRTAVLVGVVVIALVILLLALTSGSGSPGRTAAKHHLGGTRTATTNSTAATTPTTATQSTPTQTTPTQPGPAAAPGQQPGGPHGGPHGGGPPPGHAKKHGPGGKHKDH